MPSQTPEPPRVMDGQIAEWDRDLKLARKPSAADECVYARDEIFNVAMPRLLAEVKRLKADERTRFEAGGFNIGSIEEACEALDALSGQARAEAASRVMREMEIKSLLEVVPPELTEDFRAPRTTERL